MSKGFKETEIGQIPSEWEIASIADAFDIQQGKSLSAKNQTGEFKKPFLRTSNVYWGHLDLSTIDEMDFSNDERKKLKFNYGDVLVCEGGEIGRTAIWRNELVECYYQNHVFRLRPRDNNTSPFFFMYWMQAGHLILKVYFGTGNKTTIPNLSRSRLSQFLFPRPSLSEQKKIAAVLSKLQKAIEVQDNILASLRDLKKSMMHRLFSYGLKGEKRKKTEIGLIPEGWEVKPISFGILPTKQRKPIDQETIKYIDVSSVSNIQYKVVSHSKYIGNEAPGRARKIVHTGDIIIATVRPTLRRIAVIHEKFHQQFCSTAFCVLRCKNEDLNNMYLFYALQRDAVQTVLESIQRGANYPAVTDSQIKGMLIPAPSIPEQTEIAHILQTIDRKIEINEGKKSSYQDLFKTMLNKLMTGTIRVNELDIDTAEVEAA